jgi:hypothetical protein
MIVCVSKEPSGNLTRIRNGVRHRKVVNEVLCWEKMFSAGHWLRLVISETGKASNCLFPFFFDHSVFNDSTGF